MKLNTQPVNEIIEENEKKSFKGVERMSCDRLIVELNFSQNGK